MTYRDFALQWRAETELAIRGIYGKRTLRAKMRQVDSWRHERWENGEVLRVQDGTFLAAHAARISKGDAEPRGAR